MSDDFLFDKRGSDAEVEELEKLLGAYAHTAPLRDLPPRRSPWRRRAAIGAVVLAAAAAVVIVVKTRGAAPTPVATACTGSAGMPFTVENGTTRCGGAIATTGTLPIGTWLETTHDSIASVAVATIGTVTVYGDSRVRIVGTGANEHRLALASGHISAKVTAPPRLFVVETPSATAVDLGCAYDLVVDAGGTHLTVTSGAVSLEGKPYGAFVPVGMMVTSVRGHGVGVPLASRATDDVRAAVARFESSPGDTTTRALVAVLVARDDTWNRVTLWHLIERTQGDTRAFVVDALAQLAPIPEDIDRASILAADADALVRWRRQLGTD